MPNINHYDSKGLAGWVPIFRAGKQTDSKGRARVWTADDLDQVVLNHDAAHPAPHVITHKELYSPFAYARTAELKRSGDTLYAKSKDIDPQFEKLLKDGRLYERSVRLVPAAKGWKLGHIAWLGAEPPAVEGLAPVQFSADGTACDYSMDGVVSSLLSRMMRNMRDFFIEQFGMEKTDRVLPVWDVEALAEIAREADQKPELVPSFSQPPQPNPLPAGEGDKQGDDTMPFSQADIDAAVAAERQRVSAEFSTRHTETETQLRAERARRLHHEYQAQITGHIDAGRLTPAQAEGAVEFMQRLDAGEEFEFSSGDAKATKKPLDWFTDFMARLPRQVDIGAARGGEDASAGGHAEFRAPHGYAVDAEQLALDRKAKDYQQAHPGADYLTAVKAVIK